MSDKLPTIGEVIDGAGFGPGRRTEVQNWLEERFAKNTATGKTIARSMIDAVQLKPHTKGVDVPLQRIESAAKELLDALQALRLHPHQNLDFWLDLEFRDELGQLQYRSFERKPVYPIEKSIDEIRKSSSRVQSNRKGRPPRTDKLHIVKLAGDCFLKFGLMPSNDGKFEVFAKGLYSIAIGMPLPEDDGFSRQVRTYVASLKRS